MSSIEDNIKTKSEVVNVEDILANFFLKKIDMKGSRPEKDDRIRKKLKHKRYKSKHKRKSGRRYDSSERKNSSNVTSFNSDHETIGCSSGSEEKDIKRLKKLKKLDGNDPWKFNSFLPVSLSTPNVSCSNEILVQNSVYSKIGSSRGPSLNKYRVETNAEIIKEKTECKEHSILSFEKGNDTSSHVASSLSTSYYADPKLSNESISTLKESKALKFIENANETMKCKEENILNDIEKSSNKLLCTSKKFVNVLELKGPNIDSVEKLELSEKRRKYCREKSWSRSRSNSNPRTHSRSESCSSQSRSRKNSRSRSKYRYCKEKSYARDHSKSQSISRRSRSRNRSKKSRRTRSRSLRRHRRSRSWSYSRDYGKSKYNARQRSRSISISDRSRSRSKESMLQQSRRDASYYKRSSRKGISSSEKESKLIKNARSISNERYSSLKSCKIDQAKIREIAEKNVLNMIQQGTLPEGISIENFKKKELVAIKAGGKSVQELTDFCAKLSKKENEVNDTNDLNLEGENDFIHHPFKLKEQSLIKLNIKNAVQIPTKTHAEKFAETAKLSSQFPVSSGNQHKRKELEWIPVVPEESKNDLKPNENKSVIPIESATSVGKIVSPNTVEGSSSSTITSLPFSGDISSVGLSPVANHSLPAPPLPPLPPSIPPLSTPPVPPFQLLSSNVVAQTSEVKASCTNSAALQAVSYPALPLPSVSPVPTCSPAEISPFFNYQMASTSMTQFDLASVFSKKLQAEQKLQEDPNDASSLKAIQEVQAAIQGWVNSCKVPGKFYGSTHVKPLPREQLGGFKDYRLKRDILTRAAPVTEGKGMSLLKKMGWNPGEGLGKNKEGSLVPLILDIKMDKKGLVSEGETGKNNISNTVRELQGKHPVSALMELCSKRKWKPPLYTVIKDTGPPHKKQFLFKVEVNGVDYQPAMHSSNKKVAKADSAIVCLQALKVFP